MTQTNAQRLADELVHEATKRVCNVAMMPYSLPIDAAKELRRLDAIEQRYNEMMANPCPEWDGKAYMQAIANLRAQLAKSVADERERCAQIIDANIEQCYPDGRCTKYSYLTPQPSDPERTRNDHKRPARIDATAFCA